MLSPQLRQKVLNLWTMFWSSGMTNPLTSIEQITYLLFLKRLDGLDDRRKEQNKPSYYGPRKDCKLPHHKDDKPGEKGECNGHPTCKWSYISQDASFDHISQYVFPWLRVLDETILQFGNGDPGHLEQGMMSDAYFQFSREKEETLQRAIKIIEDLFQHVDTRSANADIMGDIFEYLLSEIESSGKNGQFRTPRHIIRFMVELVDPQPGERVIDPAAGTNGFLFNSIQHLLKKATNPDNIRLEWDGTPHRLTGGNADIEEFLTGKYFTGYDNDRTMVRIGWMNMILHGIENPSIARRDSLGKSLPDSESGKYKVVLANPPFTGTVDTGDLHQARFPHNPNKSTEPITNKSELLFVWLMLDLLQVSGRCAVIVPDGVLFGSTNAHIELRRQLIFEHELNAVISLPAGVFQPYAGVKTSILLFHKVGEKPIPGEPPRTPAVWFFDVQADGYSLDAKRTPQRETNDLWDALQKYPQRIIDTDDYYQPQYYTERWRLLDKEFFTLFPKLAEHFEVGQSWGVHELFPMLDADPKNAATTIQAIAHPQLEVLYNTALQSAIPAAWQSIRDTDTPTDKSKAIQKALRKNLTVLNRLFTAPMRGILDTEFEQHGKKAFNTSLEEVKAATETKLNLLIEQLTFGELNEDTAPVIWDESASKETIRGILVEFAKLDGYDILLRSKDVAPVLPENNSHAHIVENEDQPEADPQYTYDRLAWLAPVRSFVNDEDWKSEDGTITGTHDENGNVRPEYLLALKGQGIFGENGMVKSEFVDLIDPDCIEANDLNISASRYKPFKFETKKYSPPKDILIAVRELENKLITEVNSLIRKMDGTQ